MNSPARSIAELPDNIVADILSMLPAKTIVLCKCVCRSWLNLTSDPCFADIHLSRPVSGLIIHHEDESLYTNGVRTYPDPGVLKMIEIEDHRSSHRLVHDPAMSLDLRLASHLKESQILLVGSVRGLVCLWQYNAGNDNTYVCNPITREYMTLPRQEYYREGYAIIVYGFGFASNTNQYKVMRIFQGNIPPDQSSTSRPRFLEGEAYTLGSGKWRSLGHIPYWLSGFYGLLLNGLVHWIVCDQDCPETICSFDFNNETFQLVPSPPRDETGITFRSLGVFGNCLCQCNSSDSEFAIWVMRDYGVKKSWTKEVLILTNTPGAPDYLTWEPVELVKVLRDGTVLMIYYQDILLAYSPEKKAVEDTEIFPRYFTGMAFVPSFVRLTNFDLENISSF